MMRPDDIAQKFRDCKTIDELRKQGELMKEPIEKIKDDFGVGSYIWLRECWKYYYKQLSKDSQQAELF
jgi:hypothetical protein